MLLLVNNPRTCCALIDFVNTLKKGGLYVIGHVEVGQMANLSEDPCSKSTSAWLSLVDHLKVKAFVELTVAPSVREGIHQLVRISGIGAMKPNTIVLGFRDQTFHGDDFASPLSPYATSTFEGIFESARQPQRRTSIFQEPLRGSSETPFTEDGAAEGYVTQSNFIKVAKKPSSRVSRRISKEEYVGIIIDILKLRKNVCLCRHFQTLNKYSLFGRAEKASIFGTKARKRLYIDVWLVDFFSPWYTSVTDTSSLFILQLACIVNMVPRWKKMKIRVFLAARDQQSLAASSTDSVETGGHQR